MSSSCPPENSDFNQNMHELEYTDQFGLLGMNMLAGQNPSWRQSCQCLTEACVTSCCIQPRAIEKGASLKGESAEPGLQSLVSSGFALPPSPCLSFSSSPGYSLRGGWGSQIYRQLKFLAGGSGHVSTHPRGFDGLRRSHALQKQLRQNWLDPS